VDRIRARRSRDTRAIVISTTVQISLELGCSDRCDAISSPLYLQLSRGYETCSVLEIPDSVDEWAAEHRTARKRCARAQARGYYWRELRRELHAEEIYEINTSAESRQGRRMDRAYRERQEFGPLEEFPCERHAIRCTGLWTPENELVAYLTMYRCGDLALVSQILGHAAHLEREIMYLLFAGALGREIAAGPGMVVYNRHDSGTDGLRFFKERLGFVEAPVAWIP